jgi:hypothetical protein
MIQNDFVFNKNDIKDDSRFQSNRRRFNSENHDITNSYPMSFNFSPQNSFISSLTNEQSINDHETNNWKSNLISNSNQNRNRTESNSTKPNNNEINSNNIIIRNNIIQNYIRNNSSQFHDICSLPQICHIFNLKRNCNYFFFNFLSSSIEL